MEQRTSVTDADRAYERIKEMIVTLEMEPGAVIQETQLQGQLDLGRTPIREALKRLEAENLVLIKPRRGIFVADIAIRDLTQIFEVRVELEALCARLAAQRATARHIEQLMMLAEEYRRVDPGNLPELFIVDRKFHMTLAEVTANTFLARELELFYNLSLRVWYLALNYIRATNIDVDAHLDILNAIAQRDAARAEERMRDHIEHFHEAIREYL